MVNDLELYEICKKIYSVKSRNRKQETDKNEIINTLFLELKKDKTLTCCELYYWRGYRLFDKAKYENTGKYNKICSYRHLKDNDFESNCNLGTSTIKDSSNDETCLYSITESHQDLMPKCSEEKSKMFLKNCLEKKLINKNVYKYLTYLVTTPGYMKVIKGNEELRKEIKRGAANLDAFKYSKDQITIMRFKLFKEEYINFFL